MDRYKITASILKKAISFLKSGKKNGNPPVWVTKYKDDLSVKGKKLFYKEREIISRERVDDVLRKELYKPSGDVPSGRDSAFHICKQRYVGISRRALMEFIRKQKPLGEVKSALNKSKVSGGERLKNYTFETDLIFLKKNDLEKANRKFIRDDTKELTYFLSTVEKVTGLCRFDHVVNKDAKIVTPLVIKHCEDIAKQLKTKISSCSIRSDKGGEFSLKEFQKVFKDAKFVRSGVSVENKNAQFQKCFFQILRQRKATDIDDAMRQSEKLLNNTYNRIHKKTSNELVERGDEKENIREYNTKRKTFQAGDKRLPFEVGEHVRLLVKDKKAGIDYKRYKNKTYSQEVYIIERITKKTTPRKYYIHITENNKRVGKWKLQSDLLKSAPRDEKSIQLVEDRDNTFKADRKKEQVKHKKKRVEQIGKEEAAKKRPKRLAGLKAKINMLHSKGFLDAADDKLDAAEEKVDKVKMKVGKQQLKKATKNIKKLTPMHQAYIRYLKKKRLPFGGSESIVKARVEAYKKSKKKAKNAMQAKKV